MPYRRRATRRRRPIRKAPRRGNLFYRRGANKALRLAKYAVSNLNVEYKNHDFSSSGNVDSNGTIVNLLNISTGDLTINRHGKSIKLKSLAIKGGIALDTGATNPVNRFRIIIVVKKNNNLTAPAVTDVLTTSTINSLRNLDNTDNLRVIYDRRYVLDSQTSFYKLFSINMRMGLRPQYKSSSTAGAPADIEHNGLYLILLSDTLTFLPDINVTGRLRFVDN